MKRSRDREHSLKSLITLLLPNIFTGSSEYVDERLLRVYHNDELMKEVAVGNFKTLQLKVSSNDVISVDGYFRDKLNFSWIYKIGTESQLLVVGENKVRFPAKFFNRLENNIKVPSNYDFESIKKNKRY